MLLQARGEAYRSACFETGRAQTVTGPSPASLDIPSLSPVLPKPKTTTQDPQLSHLMMLSVQALQLPLP